MRGEASRAARDGRWGTVPTWVCAALLAAVGAVAGEEPAGLAVRLSRDGHYEQSAIEFRRLALAAEDGGARGAYAWAAAYQYWTNRQYELAERVLDRSADDLASRSAETALLRGELAMGRGDWDQATFFLSSAGDHASSGSMKTYAGRRLAESRLRRGDVEGARDPLAAPEQSEGAAAVEAYVAGRDKRPWLGGVLGLIPGAGYAYSGEYANALRSVLLNGLFMFGMSSTADHEQWGAFAVISFFELTWYTGSVYGGIDAAHRYNEGRLDRCAEAIGGGASFEPDYGALPVLSLRFSF